MIYPSEDKIQCGIAPALQGARSIGRQGVLNIPKGLFYYAIVLHCRATIRALDGGDGFRFKHRMTR